MGKEKREKGVGGRRGGGREEERRRKGNGRGEEMGKGGKGEREVVNKFWQGWVGALMMVVGVDLRLDELVRYLFTHFRYHNVVRELGVSGFFCVSFFRP